MSRSLIRETARDARLNNVPAFVRTQQGVSDDTPLPNVG